MKEMTTKEKIEVMQAYTEGKEIQIRNKINTEWKDWVAHSEPKWDWDTLDYRIKPEPTYRPYKDTDEMIEDFKKRFSVEVPSYAMPEIWVRHKRCGVRTSISEFRDERVVIYDAVWRMDGLFESFTYLNGSPCGIKV